MKGPAKVLLAATLIGLGTGMIYMLHSGKGGVVRDVPTYNTDASTTNTNTSTNTKVYDWARWDGESDPPNAKVIIYVDHSTDMGYGYGRIVGLAFNRMDKAISYIQISFGLYNDSGSKVGTCLDNMTNLGAGESWQFDAYCSNWTGGTYKIENVTYW